MSSEVYPGYVYQEFPKWQYHADGIRSRVVKDPEEQAALGTWWFDTPKDADMAVSVALQEVAMAARDADDRDDSGVTDGRGARKRARKPAEKDNASA